MEANNIQIGKTPQHKIGSGFGAQSTAAEVVRGLDLSRKLAVVTGGHSGLGLETTRALAGAGAKVVVGARQVAEAREAVDRIDGVEIGELDLSDLKSVRRFAEALIASGGPIDFIINNAGVMACPETRVGEGWEAQFATNHLGHYALVNRLWPLLVSGGGGRVISVSSAGHHISGIRWEDVQFNCRYDKWQAYGQSKTANVLFAVYLDTFGRNFGVRAFSVHPGKILTPLQRHLAKAEMIAAGWIDADGNLADPTFKTPQQGAATQVWAATSQQLQNMGGAYCEDCDIAELTAEGSTSFVGVREYAIDPAEAARLWLLSAELTGVNALRRIEQRRKSAQ
jgi:NAD(P)-dependent dehydrogenase (short-subunit alcohol dehydrogenase family)